jgi:urease accessory protein
MSLVPVTPLRKAVHGSGRAELHAFGDNAHFAELSYTYPLKLLSPRSSTAVQDEAAQRVAMLYNLTYGGGLIGGDCVELSLDVKTGAKLLLLTQVCNPSGSFLLKV